MCNCTCQTGIDLRAGPPGGEENNGVTSQTWTEAEQVGPKTKLGLKEHVRNAEKLTISSVSELVLPDALHSASLCNLLMSFISKYDSKKCFKQSV